MEAAAVPAAGRGAQGPAPRPAVGHAYSYNPGIETEAAPNNQSLTKNFVALRRDLAASCQPWGEAVNPLHLAAIY